MKTEKRIKKITKWIGDYAKNNDIQALIVGVSGGIDSAVVSTLSARTGLPTYAVSMPIKQNPELHSRSQSHCQWLAQNFPNVTEVTMDLTPVFAAFQKVSKGYDSPLGYANTRARIRMSALYQIAQSVNGIVVGTGNKVEDFGVGFFTKYGDGGVDISPIADCMKTEVWDMGIELGVSMEIVDAAPTDGLWEDGRTDEDQLGMSYKRLERAMSLDESGKKPKTAQEKEDLGEYRAIRARNLHKMLPIPVCKF
jgi:NAD+ synthase